MSTLFELVEDRGLEITEHESSSISVDAQVRDGAENRFELEVLEWESDLPVQSWRSDAPEDLLIQGISWAEMRESGQGIFLMRLSDRYGGEKVKFTSSEDAYGFNDALGLEDAVNYSPDPFSGLQVADTPETDPFL